MSQPKPGDRFSFTYLDEKGDSSHRAVVERILSNRDEGLSPEMDEYVADWPKRSLWTRLPASLPAPTLPSSPSPSCSAPTTKPTSRAASSP